MPEPQDYQLKGALQRLLGRPLHGFQGRASSVEVTAWMPRDKLGHQEVQQRRADTLQRS